MARLATDPPVDMFAPLTTRTPGASKPPPFTGPQRTPKSTRHHADEAAIRTETRAHRAVQVVQVQLPPWRQALAGLLLLGIGAGGMFIARPYLAVDPRVDDAETALAARHLATIRLEDKLRAEQIDAGSLRGQLDHARQTLSTLATAHAALQRQAQAQAGRSARGQAALQDLKRRLAATDAVVLTADDALLVRYPDDALFKRATLTRQGKQRLEALAEALGAAPVRIEVRSLHAPGAEGVAWVELAQRSAAAAAHLSQRVRLAAGHLTLSASAIAVDTPGSKLASANRLELRLSF